MQTWTYACLASVFLSCLAIAWFGAVAEVVLGGMLGTIFGAVVGSLLGIRQAIANFATWIIVGIILSIVIQVVFLTESNPSLFLVVLASGVGTTIAALIVASVVDFYTHHSQSNFKITVASAAELGAAIAMVFSTAHWAIVAAVILNASQKVIKNCIDEGFDKYFAIVLLLLTGTLGTALGLTFKAIGFADPSTIYLLGITYFVLIAWLLNPPEK